MKQICIVTRRYHQSGIGFEVLKAFTVPEKAEKYKLEASKNIDPDAYYEEWEIHYCELDEE